MISNYKKDLVLQSNRLFCKVRNFKTVFRTHELYKALAFQPVH